MATSLSSRSAVSTWVSSRRNPFFFGGEVKQVPGLLHLAVLKAQSLFLEQPKQLFDDPSCSVPIDDLPGGSGIGDRMAGEQPPSNGLAPRWRVGFGQFDQAQGDLCGQPRRTGLARAELEE